MNLKKISFLLIFVSFIFNSGYSLTIDKQYIQTFGTGIVAASDKGLPLRNKFDKSMFDFKDGIFYVKGGHGATISLAIFLKDGKTYGYYLNLKKNDYDPQKIIAGSERLILQIWASHDVKGRSEMTSRSVWPKKLGDTPDWSDFSMMKYNPTEIMNMSDDGCTWEDLNPNDPENYSGGSLKEWLANAKPGYKLYIQLYHSIVINYEWDPYRQVWKTMLCKGEPVAAGTIEVK
jgi:hypothetical protein